MNKQRIIGIVLVKNEDLFIERVLANILNFCDEIIVADNLSTDQTAVKVENFQKQYENKIRYISIKKPSSSHDLISEYAGKDAWVFAADGDEIYDPVGLLKLRNRILAGEFDRQWMILGNVLNCTELNQNQGYAKGYLAPPCRSMTKLYNFSAIDAWEGPCPERLHGGLIRFSEGYDKSCRLELYKDVEWDEAEFRCLHLCFLRRSSVEKERSSQDVVRKNISDLRSERIFTRLKSRCMELFGIVQESSWKREKYMRGPLVNKNIESFLC